MFCSCSTKESLSIGLAIVCLILLFSLIQSQSSSEGFPSSASLNAKAEMCLRFGGRVSNDLKHCVMPQAVQNDQILNWQMGGRVCDLDTVYETQGCSDGIERPPWTMNANRGNFHYNSF